MIIKRLLLSFSLIALFGCQEVDKKEAVDVSSEIAALKSISDQAKYLEAIYQSDQGIRNGESSEILLEYGEDSEELQAFYHKMNSVDQLNLERIDGYLEKFGYPELDSFSRNANLAPWLVIHHETQPQIRNEYFTILKQAYESGNMSSTQFEIYLGRTYQIINGKYPASEGSYKVEEKIRWLIEELELDKS